MKLLILSDVHLEFGDFEPPPLAVDAVILAGDIGHGAAGIRWAQQHFPPARTVCILGNHEFYGGEFFAVVAACRQAAAETGVRFLDNDAIVIDGVRFLGTALWADFRFYGEAQQQAAMKTAARTVSDFRLVDIDRRQRRRRHFRPQDVITFHRAARRFLEAELARPFDGKTVVVTHFLPSPRSVAPKFEGDPLNPYFCTDLGALIEEGRPDLWVHGHTHESFDYRIGRTRVVCNPRGYFPFELNPRFNPGLVVEL